MEPKMTIQNNYFAQALTIAGSDSGGGAGIQADLKTMQMRGVFGMSVITAITAQNTLGVTDIHPIPTTTISAQLKAIADDFAPTAFKVGMLGNAEIIHCVADALRTYDFGLCVLDPVMIAKGGASLLEDTAINALTNELLPLADVLTPNIPEAEALTGMQIHNLEDMKKAAKKLQTTGAKTVIIKGGHQLDATLRDESTDYVLTPEGEFTLTAKRFDTPHTHGTGCTFSACITAELAKSHSFEQAIRTAKDFITCAISNPLINQQGGIGIGHGHGAVNHWAYSNSKA